ncbi:MAG: InlB B-repeat-containing protein, partial [Clostridia bacterium]
MIKLEDLPTDVFVGTKLSVSGRKIQCDELRTEARITDPVTGEEKNELMEIPVQDTYCTIADDTVLVREIAGTWSDGAPSAGTSLTINASNCEVTGTPAPGSKVALLETDGTLHAFQAGQGTNSSTLVVGERIPAADCISYANLQTRRAIPLPFPEIPLPSSSGILKLSGGQIIFNLELEFRQTGHASFYLRVRDFSFELNLPKVYSLIYNPIGMISTEVPLGKFEIPITYGLGLDFTPTFSLEGEGWGPCEFSLNQKGGMVLEMELDFPKKFRISRCGYYRSLPSSKMLDTELNGELYYGFSWGPMLSCLEGLISVGPTVKAGMTARSRRSPTDTQFEPDWKTRNVYHACAPGKCYEGEFCISEGPIAVSVTILYHSITILKITKKKDYPPHGYFFHSLTYGDRSPNEHCWHRAYKLRVYADTKDKEHSPPQKAHITYSVIPDGRYEWVASDDTKEFQPAVIYVPAGRHTITGTIVSPADPSIKQTVTMDIDMPRNTAGTETRTLLFDIPTYEIKFDSNIGEPVQYMPPAIRIQPFYTPKAYITSYAPEVISGRVAFIGWNTEPDGSGTMYAPGSTVTVEKDMTLYAQWSFAQD